MNKDLKNIVKKFLSFDINEDIDKSSQFFAVSVALIKLDIGNLNSSSLTEHSDYRIVKNKFPELVSSFEQIYNKISYEKRGVIFKDMKLIVEKSDSFSDDIISWSYQFMKKTLEKEAFGKLGRDKVKIEGKDLLYTTQFFTDKYMAEYLVNIFCIKLNKENIAKTTFYDMACGGGNFLNLLANKCFDLLSKYKPEWDCDKKVGFILSDMLVGYDLDSNISKIASISVFVNLAKYCSISKIHRPYIFGGRFDDLLGYIAEEVQSETLNNTSIEDCLNKPHDHQRFFITNPPFMGKRDMSLELKEKLNQIFPDCNADLCASFISRSLERLKNNDSLAVVMQSNWMHLKSFKKYRKRILENYHISDCVDLGTKAFKEINGEKTSVSLCFFELNKGEKTRFQNYKYLSYKEKEEALSKIDPNNVYYAYQEDFLTNEDFEITHELNDSFKTLDKLPAYGNFGTPMQGTSTGDNKNFVKYFWEVNDNEKWRYVSKGGGFSKWSGLNYFKVLWGKNAEEIKNNPGSAIRNIDKINVTDLVYSDTGTLGLNIRVLEHNQVFIASGPGIEVKYGDKYAHLAFLNSRLASFLLKMKNPKFTVSAGYISKIPVKEKLLHSETLSSYGKQALLLKREYLKNKLPNPEFDETSNYENAPSDEIIERLIISDFKNDFSRLKLADRIDQEIIESFKLNKKELKKITSVVGSSPFKIKFSQDSSINLDDLDTKISKLLDINCLFKGKSINGYTYGTDSIVEHLSYEFHIHPTKLLKVVSDNLSKLHQTKRIFLMDYYHKFLLTTLNVNRISDIPKTEISIDKLIEVFETAVANDNYSEDTRKLVEKLILKHHFKSFKKRPFITLDSTHVKVGHHQ
ncbi:Eco57I restriction-modification methylase domain-containing protein [Persicobacter psychrovividus]|uniref:site-specific DNA-methyltransferase (adenine-specific) n=1 Tax=Persicobacter psychrovividus TaxID=387638 RepID=A0ABN6LH07_9BACT|nr:hypothetical protein PEPS_47130 [Persicobacter psychrovividus]